MDNIKNIFVNLIVARLVSIIGDIKQRIKISGVFLCTSVSMLFFGCGCNKDINVNYQNEMRNFVVEISKYAKSINPNFIIIPQNGHELITNNGEPTGEINIDYINAVDATGRESLFFGYNKDDEATPEKEMQYMLDFCLLWKNVGKKILTTDYCSTKIKMGVSYQKNEENGFISFVADQRNLSNIPDYPNTPYNVNIDNISDISQAKNFLYLINPEKFNTKQDFIDSVRKTNYDIVIMDLFHFEKSYLPTEIEQLKVKQNGGKRVVICYMSIGEAENYRYYWQSNWRVGNPFWLEKENPAWNGNYKVRYWEKGWKDIIFGKDNSYLKKILDAGFNGVYLDVIDAFDYFNNLIKR